MADHAIDDGFDGDGIFIYRGGRAPQHIVHARIDKSVDEIEVQAFRDCEHLVQVDTHDDIRRVGIFAFFGCGSLRRINLKSTVEIGDSAFWMCTNLESVEFGDRLETIGELAFAHCTSLNHLKLPSIITIGPNAFGSCRSLTDIELSEHIELIGGGAFFNCNSLQRIAIPLKRDLFDDYDEREEYFPFDHCDQLVTVDLIGQDHTRAIASLHMESWKTEMIAEINRINQVLPTTKYGKTDTIRQWIDSVMDKLCDYIDVHYKYVEEGITLLELALWKAKLCEKDERSVDSAEGKSKKAKIDAESARKEKRVTCGADIVIKNVLPFLEME